MEGGKIEISAEQHYTLQKQGVPYDTPCEKRIQIMLKALRQAY